MLRKYKIMEYKDKKILIIGLARSGLAAARLLHRLGANITITETKPFDMIPESAELREMGIRLEKQSGRIFEEDFDLVIKNPGINGNQPFIRQFRDRDIPVTTEIELGYDVCPDAHYIAITGTNGKTTTCTLLHKILEKAYPGRAFLSGNIGVALCDTLLGSGIYDGKCEKPYIVLEISNFQLLDIISFRPEIATIINLAADHLDFMGSEYAYYCSKCRIYENMRDGDVFLKNADDSIISDYTKNIHVKCDTATFGFGNDAFYRSDGEYILAGEEKIMPVSEIKIPGKHNIQNILVAVGAAKKCGVPNEIIRQVIADFYGVEHRIEFVAEKNGVRYYNDSKGTNVDATITALKAFDKPIILLAGGFEKGLSFSPMKPYMGNVKQTIAFGACGERLYRELTAGKGILVKTMNEALSEAVKIAEPGDIVLLSPTTSSFDQFSCFEERGDKFREAVLAL